ncbi:hypothetical protein Purlil1_9820 [Purpureocillium lilacinum]|uniref:Clr5 domain-containing protein n=1 Tax=Purpureocillium lilacinum TaxID=33203 RepID=A0ABR0BQQ2_PURLI|nr:hypothetical protein Purlil1_9820 [Purpureocillium lilacinum]
MARRNWDNHKAEIERLFIRENRPLSEVIGVLASSHDFHASKAQFERKLKEWGLRKNRMKKGDWKVVSAKLAKRKRETGKDYEIYIDGVRCPSPKVRKETARHSYVSTIDKLRPPEDAPSPATPAIVTILSPPSCAAAQQWQSELPWFKFLQNIPSDIVQGKRSLS